MLRIQRALLAELLLIFLLVTFALTAVVFLGVSLRFVQQGGGALGADALLMLLPNMIPLALIYSVPLGWLTSCALTFGRWSSDHELVALTAAGIHLRTLAVPAIVVGTLLAVGGMYYNGWQVPVKNREMVAKLRDYVPQFLASLRGTERSVTFDHGRLSFDHWDSEARGLRGFELDRYDRTGQLTEKVTGELLRLQHVHERTQGDGLALHIQGAYVMRGPKGGAEISYQGAYNVTVGHVQRVGVSMRFNEFLGAPTYRLKPRDLTVPELLYGLAHGRVAPMPGEYLSIALHGRLALGAAALFMGLFAMAMALALPASSHRVRDFTLCTAPVVLTFFPLQIAGPTFARSSDIPPWLLMWLPNILLLAASVFLLRRAFRR